MDSGKKELKRVPLKLGISDNRFTEVVSGNLNESHQIIVEVKTNDKTRNTGPGAGPPRGQGFKTMALIETDQLEKNMKSVTASFTRWIKYPLRFPRANLLLSWDRPAPVNRPL